eukprot:7573627-Karenia_brevis.AAC.1
MCGKNWQLCSEHFAATASATESPNSSSASSSQTPPPQPLPRARSDSCLAKLEPHRASKLCLGPILAARFPKLAQL